MFRVPVSAEAPTFDDTFKVSFWRWLTSHAGQRKEWMQRRTAAARVAGANQEARRRARREAR